ncbi:hypothetical protein PCANC_07475 [Puccinia coronata f. sp. avenae]|uniref:No apical meristem-associated C-terminal domain-containing protein n=1 Tax=Puccinia coronata f. sp. avenae TaxID=200324 RepID=A0A2N5VTB3_9BASI|nr:hypothetical protein PCANC_07475 [Puccinia coronata f. sp. avenae]
MALLLYGKIKGKPFPYISCYKIIIKKKAKVKYQEQQLDVSNHKELKKMVAAHGEIADVVKKQQMSLNPQNTNSQRLANEAIMSKDLSGTSEMLDRRWPFVRFYVEPTFPTPPKIFGVSQCGKPWQLTSAQPPTKCITSNFRQVVHYKPSAIPYGNPTAAYFASPAQIVCYQASGRTPRKIIVGPA